MDLSKSVLAFAVLGWGVLCGAMIYEHVAAVPVWTKRPPQSLTMWLGEYRLRAERFWIPIHPILVVSLVIAVALGWNVPGRKELLLPVIGGYVAIIAVTAVFFVPELMRLVRDPNAPIPADEWKSRAKRWEALSLTRGAVMLGLGGVLLTAFGTT